MARPRLTSEEFIKKARVVHGDRYGYESVRYVRNSDKVTIDCPEHGAFEQTAASHLKGSGCAKCAALAKSLKPEGFVAQARLVHGLRYDYEYTSYVNCYTKVTITCSEHGSFEQTPNTHLRDHGCPKCASHGFNPNKQAYLYIMVDTETSSRVKIGVSNVPDRRLHGLRRETPFTLGRMDLFETPPEITMQIEKFCHSQLTSANLTGFNGATEWFEFDGETIEALREFIKSCGGTPA